MNFKLVSVVIGSLATMSVSLPAFAVQSSERLPSDAKNIKISDVQIGAYVMGYHKVDSGIACTSESSPNDCGIISVPDLGPTLTVAVDYDSNKEVCGDDTTMSTTCTAYFEFRITQAQEATLKAKRKNGLKLVSLASLSVQSETFQNVYPQGHYVDCTFDNDSGSEYGPDCHYVNDAPIIGNEVDPVATVTAQLQ